MTYSIYCGFTGLAVPVVKCQYYLNSLHFKAAYVEDNLFHSIFSNISEICAYLISMLLFMLIESTQKHTINAFCVCGGWGVLCVWSIDRHTHTHFELGSIQNQSALEN